LLIVLEQYLKHRPEVNTLVGKNILKDTQLAPTLIQVSEKLKWEKKTAYLQHKINDRPELNSLITRGIIKEKSEVENQRMQVVSNLEYLLNHRPNPKDLKQKHIIPYSPTTAPAIQAVQHKLERDSQKIILSNRLMHRPSLEEVKRKIVFFDPAAVEDKCKCDTSTSNYNDIIANDGSDSEYDGDVDDENDDFVP
jgi:hypothetical protein